MQADLLELFGKTTADLSDKDAKVLEDQWADELENMDTFVLSNGSFVRMPATRVGHFFDEECYVFMCTQVDDLRAVPLLTFFACSGDSSLRKLVGKMTRRKWSVLHTFGKVARPRTWAG